MEARARHGVAALATVVVALALGVPAASAQERHVRADANPSSLGAIPAATGGSCSTKVVTFDVTGLDVVRNLQVDLTMSYARLGAHGAVLTSPGGRGFALFTVLGPTSYLNPVSGRYLFGDTGIGSWLTAAPSNPSLPVGTGLYRTLNGTTVTSLDAAFAGDRASGRWSLMFLNCYSPTAGQVTEAALVVGGTTGVATSAVSGTLGAIPDGPSMLPQIPGAPRDVLFAVPAGRGTVTSVSLRMTLTHPVAGDLMVRLIAPTGASHVIFGYTGALSATAYGSRADLNGTYAFRDAASTGWWTTVSSAGSGVVPGGVYRTNAPGGAGATGAATQMDPVFSGLPSAGTWILRITDGAALDVGTITEAELSLETSSLPTGRDDTYVTSYLTALAIAAPGVLANDSDGGGGALAAVLATSPAHGTLSLRSTGDFTYVPRPGFLGTDSFRYRPVSFYGVAPAVTVTITVAAPTTLQPPSDLMASEIADQQVTLRWKVPPGPAPTDFVLEGGVVPGQPLAAIGIGGPLPVLSFQVPRGIYFIRVRAVAGGVTSAPSNEIRIVVGVPELPSAPTHLAGVVNGDALGLSWRNTFAGGEPGDLQLLVSGSATTAVTLPLGESLSLGGIPPGTYTFRMRARNGTGASGESNPVMLTFPGGCSGAPAAPENLLVFAVGNVVHAYWDPPASGPATTNYLLHVTGSFTGSVPMAARQLHAPAPPGSYAIAVAALNACGASAPTPAQVALVR